MTIQLWDKGYVTDEVSSVPANECNKDEESRIMFCTDCAAISRNKLHSSNPPKRYQALLKEAAPNTCDDDEDCKGVAGRPLEFIGVAIPQKSELGKLILSEMSDYDYVNNLLPFSYLEDEILYTNMRALLNAGIPYNKIHYNSSEETAMFKAVRVKAPYFVFAQIRTHCRISQIASGGRVVDEDELWLPDDFGNRYDENHSVVFPMLKEYLPITKTTQGAIVHGVIQQMWKTLPTEVLQNVLKALSYKKEIWQRYPTMAIYKTWVMAGWMNDPKVWEHFFLERSVFEDKYKNWTQPETQYVAKAIAQVIDPDVTFEMFTPFIK